MSFGVYQAHYTDNEFFKDSRVIPIVGSLATGISNFGFGLVAPLALRYPQHARHMVWFGWSLCVLSLILASFATSVWHLVLTQGIIYGCGWVISYTPFLLMMNQWFVQRRGLAYGICFSASGFSELGIPFALEWLLRHYGFRVTLRASAAAICVLTGPALPLIKPRVVERKEASHIATNLDFLRSKSFYLFAAAVLLQGVCFYVPSLFLPSFALSANLSHGQGALLLALHGFAQVAAQLGMGQISDMVNIHIPVVLGTGVSALVTFLLWGPAKSLAPLAAFATVYSLFSSGYSVLWTRLSTYLAHDEASATAIYGVFAFERGIGTVLAGPISAALLGSEVHVKDFGLAKYAGIVVFVGSAMALSTILVLINVFIVSVESRRAGTNHRRMLLPDSDLARHVRADSSIELVENEPMARQSFSQNDTG